MRGGEIAHRIDLHYGKDGRIMPPLDEDDNGKPNYWDSLVIVSDGAGVYFALR